MLKYSTTLLVAGLFIFTSACKKSDNSNIIIPPPLAQNDTTYLLTGMTLDGKFLDSLVYDTATGLPQKVIYSDIDTGYVSHQELFYNADKLVNLVLDYDRNNRLIRRETYSYNSDNYGVAIRYITQNNGLDSGILITGAGYRPVQNGSKDTTTIWPWRFNYTIWTYTGNNVAEVGTNYYYSSYAGTYTSIVSSKKYTYDNHPNPTYSLFRHFPAFTNSGRLYLDFLENTENNPASFTIVSNKTTHNDGAADKIETNNDGGTIAYVYDAVSHYPTQQRYTIKVINPRNDMFEPVSHTISYSYKSIIKSK